jgi:DNA integrity scanning protein DisA with diadenylate cyclase activity
MFINKSMRHFASTINKSDFIGGQDFSKQNNCLFNSVIFSIENGRVSLSYINDTFLTIENGLLMPKKFYGFEIHWILEISRKFSKKRRSMLGGKFHRFSTNDLVKIYKNEKLDKDSRQSAEIYILAEDLIVESLRNIFKKISEARHGTIMIFNFKGNSNDPSLFHPGFIKVKLPYGTKLLELLEFDDPIKLLKKEKLELFDNIRKYEEAIVSLSFTDGAMVFDQNLDLIMTGAFLKIDSSSSSPGGARRKSAEGFIIDNKETLGLVFSQDGTVTLLPEANEILNRYPPFADVYKKILEQFEKRVQNNSNS